MKMRFGKKKESVSTNKVRIEVFRLLGGKVPYSIAKFEAMQEKEDNNNLVLVDSNSQFKDEVDIVQHRLMQDLKERLDIYKLDEQEQIDLVTKKIKEQQTFISAIKKGYVEEKQEDKSVKKIKVNRLDEDCKLREYEVLLDTLKNSGSGSYESVDSDGLKRIFYLYREGIFIPYKFIKNKTNLYPDAATERKLYKENQDAIDLDFLHDNRGFFTGWKRYVGIAILLILMIGNIYWSINLNAAYSNLDERKTEEYSTKCAYWCVNMVNETKSFISAYDNMVSEKEETISSDGVSIG